MMVSGNLRKCNNQKNFVKIKKEEEVFDDKY